MRPRIFVMTGNGNTSLIPHCPITSFVHDLIIFLNFPQSPFNEGFA